MEKTSLALLALVGLFALAVVSSAFAGGPNPPPSREDRVVQTDAEWKGKLSAEEYRILREKGTERPFTGKYWDDKTEGVYLCAACGLELFHSDQKFKSGTGWPSWYKPIAEGRIDEHSDGAFGMVRTEITCARCGGHLGHVFNDGPQPTGLRYCVNGNALDKNEPVKDQPPGAK